MITQDKWLSGSELDILDPIFESRGWTPLDKTKTIAHCVFDDQGDLIAFNVAQKIAYVGPMWIDPDFRGSGVAEELADKMAILMASSGSTFIVVADNPASAKLCEKFGMKKVESPVYLL